jgi:hypothetical protein
MRGQSRNDYSNFRRNKQTKKRGNANKMSTTETENYSERKITSFTGKKFKWTGKAIRKGRWPEYPEDSTYSIDVYETKGQTLVAWITNDREGLSDVVSADTEENLIAELQDHEWASEEYFMAALQNTFPEEDIWVEEIE